jgi:transcriptional regulator with XRE-family HTH domain
MSLTAYSNIESGKTENITLPRLKQIANALEVDIAAILNVHAQTNNPHITNLQNELHQTKEQLHKANEHIEFLRGGG